VPSTGGKSTHSFFQGRAHYQKDQKDQKGVWRHDEYPLSVLSGIDGTPTMARTNVTRAVKAVTAAGVHIARIEIDKSGKIVIIAADPTEQPGETTEANEWDRI